MSIIVPNVAEVALLDGTWNGLADDLELKLYKVDVTAGLTPTEIQELEAADFIEADFVGYSPVSLLAAGSAVTAGDPTTGVHAEQSFTSTANQTQPQNIFGYYVVDAVGGTLRWFEDFPTGPVVVEFLDDQILITPTLTLDDREGNAVPVGEIVGFGGETPPAGWLLCDGSAVSRSTHSLLFAVIGETYGVGDGSTTFGLPDLRQRFPLGKAASGTGVALGESGGSIDHTHGLNTASSHAKVNVAGTNQPTILRKAVTAWTANRQGSTTGADSTGSQSFGAELAGDSASENPPYLTLNFIIKT